VINPFGLIDDAPAIIVRRLKEILGHAGDGR
jgi:hypothetical protein